MEGRDDEVLHFDGGEFYQWLKDCETGAEVSGATLLVWQAHNAALKGRFWSKSSHVCCSLGAFISFQAHTALLLAREALPSDKCQAMSLALHDCGSRAGAWLAYAGAANAEDGFCYPLIVQDQDMRTVLEIKPPGEPGKQQQQQDAIGHVAKECPIWVPMIKVLRTELGPALPCIGRSISRAALKVGVGQCWHLSYHNPANTSCCDSACLRVMDPCTSR